MAQIYVWRPRGVRADEAERRFAGSLECQRIEYESAFGRSYGLHLRRVGDVLVGAITTDLGVRDWSGWVRGDGVGLAWSGVCEEFLGATWGPERVAETVGLLLERPEQIAEWRGSFAVAAWNDAERRVVVATGAAQSQTMWHVEGADGWACGSRARPLLGWVGRSPELDDVQASLFVSFGYLAGTGSLFRHVERLPSRRHVALEAHEPARIREYVDLGEFLHGEGLTDRSIPDIASHCAERYVARVATQHRYSRAPVLSLTGGRDSRSIAAALAHTGFAGPTRTGGLPHSDDVTLAAVVARTLGFTHENVGSDAHLVERLHASWDRALAWSRSSEGVETIRHALHYDAFFRQDGTFEDAPRQNFNGLRPFLNRRHAPGWQRDELRAKIRGDVHHAEEARAHFDELARLLDGDVREAGGNANHFAELHFWQVKVLHSGQDNVLVKDMFSLWWTPLLDPTLIRANWHLPTDRLPRATFIESLTRALAPEVAAIRYAGEPTTRFQGMLERIRRKIPRPLRPARKPSFAVSPERRSLWESIFFEREAIVWRDLVEPATVHRSLDTSRSDHLLWSLATIELFAQAHLMGSEDASAMLGSPPPSFASTTP